MVSDDGFTNKKNVLQQIVIHSAVLPFNSIVNATAEFVGFVDFWKASNSENLLFWDWINDPLKPVKVFEVSTLTKNLRGCTR